MLAPVEFFSIELFRMQGRLTTLEGQKASMQGNPYFNLFLYSGSPQVTIPIDEETPVRGAPDAKHTVVMFTDFQCAPCSKFHRASAEAVRALPGKVKVYFKHFPLGKACNPNALSPSYHPLSCAAAYAGEAARKQGKFWDYADLLFERREKIDENGFVALAEELHLNVEEFRKDSSSEEVRKRVEADIALGNSLRIPGTPGVYLDGRALVGNDAVPMFWSLLQALDSAPPSLLSGPQAAFAPTSATPEIAGASP
jgi:protein-disulfide isomerase